MGMSMPKAASERLEYLFDKQADYMQQVKAESGQDFIPGQVFVEQPRMKDYYNSVNLPAWQVTSDGRCKRIGYVKVTNEGSMSVPKAVRQAFGI